MPSLSRFARPLRRFFATLLIALSAGALAARFGWPLPWMLGPLLAVALARLCGAACGVPRPGRQLGQWAIGVALGLNFTPAVVAQLSAHGALIAAVAAASVGAGILGALLLRRLAGVDTATAFFAALPGGASEMATLAERQQAAVDRVAAAHALRILLVVAAVPLFLYQAGAHGDILDEPAARVVDWTRMPFLVAASLAGGGLLLALRQPNAWVLGPLAGVGLATAQGIALSSLPAWAVNGGQLLIGASLGARFSREFFAAAPRFVAAALAVGVFGLLLAGACALALGALAAVPPATLLLAAAPGGVAEMSITAQVLKLGVPLVTACHVLRVIVLTVGAQPAYRWFARRFAAE